MITYVLKNKFFTNFVKIDVEGAEYDLLLGAKHVLKDVKVIMVEISNNENDICNFLNNLSFKKINVLNKSKTIIFVK